MSVFPADDESVSRAWQTIQVDAAALAKREPFLEPTLTRCVQEPDNINDALARMLADTLASHHMRNEAGFNLYSGLLHATPSIAAAATRDLVAIEIHDPACPSTLHAFLNYKGFLAVQAYRIANKLWKNGRRELAASISNRVSVVLGPDIHPAARLGTGIMLDHGSGIVIGETAVVEDDVSILQNVTLGGTGKTDGDRHPKIRRGVMIGAGANVIGNIEVGERSKIAAGSVVLKDVPPGCTVAGIPAQIVRLHTGNEALAKPTRNGSTLNGSTVRNESNHLRSVWAG